MGALMNFKKKSFFNILSNSKIYEFMIKMLKATHIPDAIMSNLVHII